MRKLITYCSLFILTGCLTSGGSGSYRSSVKTKTGGKKTEKKENPRKKSDDVSTSSTLKYLSRAETVKDKVLETNSKAIKKSFETYNRNVTTVDDKLTVNEANLAKADEYLIASTRTENPIDISSMISTITSLQSDYIEYTAYKSAYDSLNHVLKTSADFTNANEYANYLQSNAESGILKEQKVSTVREVDDAVYIAKIEKAYFDYLKKHISGLTSVDYTAYSSADGSSAAYTDLMTNLAAQVETQKSSMDTKKDAVISDLKALDPSVNELPLTINDVVKYWRTQQKILIAIQNTKYLPDVSTKTDDMKSVALNEDLNTVNIKYVYNKGLEDYTLDAGKANGETLSFKASDFEKDTITRSYVAKKASDEETIENAITFLPNLWAYLNNGGKTDSEFKKRKDYAQTVFVKVKNGTATVGEKADFENWVKDPNTGISFINIENLSNVSSDDYKNWNIANIILKSAKDVDFTLTKKETKTDTVYLGGAYTGLTFSDYGIWQTKASSYYTGNKTLLSYLSSTSAKSVNVVGNYMFYSGLESFKQAYPANQTRGSVSFVGNTLAYADLVGTSGERISKQLIGAAKLSISPASVADLTLGFEGWYGFTIEGIDVSTPDFSSENPAKITTSCASCGWVKSPTFTSKVFGSQYGLDAEKPTEAVGAYKIETNDVADPSKYTKVIIKGAFGVKE